MIKIKDLSKIYSGRIVLNIDNFIVNENEIVGIVGNNGAGKTTLFRLILDLIRADSGTISICDNPVTKSEVWKNITGSYLEESFLIDFLTPEEYFNFIAKIYDIDQIALANRLSFFELFFKEEILNQKFKLIRDYSKGDRQKIGIVSSLIADPQVLILDEPFNHLDPSSQIVLKKILKKVNSTKGTTILLSSHNLNHLSELCSRICLMEKGSIIKDVNSSLTEITGISQYFQDQIVCTGE